MAKKKIDSKKKIDVKKPIEGDLVQKYTKMKGLRKIYVEWKRSAWKKRKLEVYKNVDCELKNWGGCAHFKEAVELSLKLVTGNKPLKDDFFKQPNTAPNFKLLKAVTESGLLKGIYKAHFPNQEIPDDLPQLPVREGPERVTIPGRLFTMRKEDAEKHGIPYVPIR